MKYAHGPNYKTPTHNLSIRHLRVNKFIRNLWNTVSDPALRDIITWSPSGKTFYVYDSEVFAETILLNNFSINNWKAFHRQLNFYGFRRVNNISVKMREFHNDFFQRDDMDLLPLLVRNDIQRNQNKNHPNAIKKNSPPLKATPELKHSSKQGILSQKAYRSMNSSRRSLVVRIDFNRKKTKGSECGSNEHSKKVIDEIMLSEPDSPH